MKDFFLQSKVNVFWFGDLLLCCCCIIIGCNRTYYGDIGVTYALELHRPKQGRLPYVCLLTFTAAGGQYGDVVQVSQLFY